MIERVLKDFSNIDHNFDNIRGSIIIRTIENKDDYLDYIAKNKYYGWFSSTYNLIFGYNDELFICANIIVNHGLFISPESAMIKLMENYEIYVMNL